LAYGEELFYEDAQNGSDIRLVRVPTPEIRLRLEVLLGRLLGLNLRTLVEARGLAPSPGEETKDHWGMGGIAGFKATRGKWRTELSYGIKEQESDLLKLSQQDLMFSLGYLWGQER
jgi:hypothetical protein